MCCPSNPSGPKLCSSNYIEWADYMEAWLRANGLWRIILGSQKHPVDSESSELSAFEVSCDRASGWIYLSLEPEQWIHVKAHMDDPAAMWKALQAIYGQGKEPLQPQPVAEVSPSPPVMDSSSTLAPAHSEDEIVAEFAGNATLLSVSSSDEEGDTSWTPDTGATSHMTPHHHWMRN